MLTPSRRSLCRLIPALLATVFVAACGGGSGAVGDLGPTPTAQILFPPAVSLTTADAITVRGVSTNGGSIGAIRVNGQAATTTDGFATWRAKVPIALGATDLRVDIETASGNVVLDAAKARIRRTTALISNASSADRDPITGEVYVHDRFEGLLKYAPSSEVWSRVSPEGPFDEESSRSATGGAFDPSTNTYYQLYLDALLAIDVQTGARTPVTGSGPALSRRMRDMDVDDGGNVYIVGDFPSVGSDALIGVDARTGDRVDLGSDAVGGGTPFSTPAAVHVPSGQQMVYVYDSGRRALLRVDLATKNRELLLDDTMLTQVLPNRSIAGLLVDPPSRTAYLADSDALYLLDWEAGAVTTVFEREAGFLGRVGVLTDIAPGPGDRVLLLDRPRDHLGWAGLATFDPGASTVTVHTETEVGSGARASVHDVRDIVVDPARRALLLLGTDGFLHSVDLLTGDRTVVSSDTVGSGPAISIDFGVALAIDGADTAYVSLSDEIYAVDVPTGARHLLSAEGVAGTGPALANQGGLSWDPVRGTPVVSEEGDQRLMRVDPATGDRILFTAEVVDELYDQDLDASRDRLVLAIETESDGYLVATVELGTGVFAPLLYMQDVPALDGEGVEILATDPETGRIFIPNSPAVYELDPVSGAPSLITDTRDSASGAPTRQMLNLCVAPRIGVVYLAAEGSVMALDAETGERVVIAK